MAAWDFSPKLEKRARRDFSRAELSDVLTYCPETGVFRWKVKVMCHGGGREPGEEAGTVGSGYRQITVFGRVYRAHHLAWLMMTGTWPEPGIDIDHINCIRSDNRWENLRPATRSQNNLNTRRPRSDNTSGYRGVARRAGSKRKPEGRWFARITVNGRVIHLGMFDSIDEAIAARKRAEVEHYGQFA